MVHASIAKQTTANGWGFLQAEGRITAQDEFEEGEVG